MHTDVDFPVRRWTTEEYMRMGELGILPETGVELMDGLVREKNAWGSPKRWTYEDFSRMVTGGIVDEDERLELIDGDIVCMSPVGHRHIYTVDLLTAFFGEQARGRAILRVQSPLRFNTGEAPVPDLILLRMHPDRYRSREAGPWDALLIVEVADTSVTRDQEKAGLYARGAVPEYWIVNIDRRIVAVHQAPVAGEYTDVHEYPFTSGFASAALAGRMVHVSELLGPA